MCFPASGPVPGPGPGPNLYLMTPAPNLYFTAPALNLYLPVPALSLCSAVLRFTVKVCSSYSVTYLNSTSTYMCTNLLSIILAISKFQLLEISLQ